MPAVTQRMHARAPSIPLLQAPTLLLQVRPDCTLTCLTAVSWLYMWYAPHLHWRRCLLRTTARQAPPARRRRAARAARLLARRRELGVPAADQRLERARLHGVALVLRARARASAAARDAQPRLAVRSRRVRIARRARPGPARCPWARRRWRPQGHPRRAPAAAAARRCAHPAARRPAWPSVRCRGVRI